MYIVEVTSNISIAYLPPPYMGVGRVERESTMKNAKECLMERKVEIDVLRCFVAFMDVPSKI